MVSLRRRERWTILAALAATTAIAWIYLVAVAAGMDDRTPWSRRCSQCGCGTLSTSR